MRLDGKKRAIYSTFPLNSPSTHTDKVVHKNRARTQTHTYKFIHTHAPMLSSVPLAVIFLSAFSLRVSCDLGGVHEYIYAEGVRVCVGGRRVGGRVSACKRKTSLPPFPSLHIRQSTKMLHVPPDNDASFPPHPSHIPQNPSPMPPMPTPNAPEEVENGHVFRVWLHSSSTSSSGGDARR